MSVEYLNRLRVSGTEAEVSSLVADASSADGELTFGAAVPGVEFEDEPLAIVDAPDTSSSNGLSVVEYTFSTDKGGAETFAAALAAARPSLVLLLRTVAPDVRHAEAVVHKGAERWDYETDRNEYDDVEARADEDGDDLDVALMDMLEDSTASVVDDYERMVDASPKP